MTELEVTGKFRPTCQRCRVVEVREKFEEKVWENNAEGEVASHVEDARSCRVRQQGSDSEEVTGGTAASSRH